MKFSRFYEFKKEELPRQLYEEIRYTLYILYRLKSYIEYKLKIHEVVKL